MAATSCHPGGNGIGERESASEAASSTTRTDTIAVALVPTLDALPLYWARRQGLDQRQGFVLAITAFDDQADCDTALLGGSVAAGIASLTAVDKAKARAAKWTVVTATSGCWGIVGSRAARLSEMADLERHTLAVGVDDDEPRLVDRVLAEQGVASHVMMPHVGNLALRVAMLAERQTDAALLPEPALTIALGQGHTLLWADTLGSSRLRALVVAQQVAEARRQQLVALYNEAVDSINARGKAACLDVLQADYDLSADEAAQVHLPRYAKAVAEGR